MESKQRKTRPGEHSMEATLSISSLDRHLVRTIAQAGAVLERSRGTVRSFIDRGALHVVGRDDQGRVLLDAAEVDALRSRLQDTRDERILQRDIAGSRKFERQLEIDDARLALRRADTLAPVEPASDEPDKLLASVSALLESMEREQRTQARERREARDLANDLLELLLVGGGIVGLAWLVREQGLNQPPGAPPDLALLPKP